MDEQSLLGATMKKFTMWLGRFQVFTIFLILAVSCKPQQEQFTQKGVVQVNKNPPGESPGQCIKFTKIAAGRLHSLALAEDGTLWSWGYNEHGGLGDGSTIDRPTAVKVVGMSGVADIATGGSWHTLVLKKDGTVWAFGLNVSGQLGIGSHDDSLVPVQVSNLNNIIAIAAAQAHSLALRQDGTVWGFGNGFHGQLGPNNIGSKIPMQIPGITGAIAIAAGEEFSLVLKADGTVWGMGYNDGGELGDGTNHNVRYTPVQVKLPKTTKIVAIAAGEDHSLALNQDGTVWAFGKNDSGQLGDGTRIGRTTPVMIPGLTGVTKISAAIWHSTVLKQDGTVWAFGYDMFDGYSTAITQVPGISDVKTIDENGFHLLVLKKDGSVFATGKNMYGQLGNGTTNLPNTFSAEKILDPIDPSCGM